MANAFSKGPNFNPTGGNTAPPNRGTNPSVGLRSQKNELGYDKFGKGIAKSTSRSSGSAEGRRNPGKSSTFMNK